MRKERRIGGLFLGIAWVHAWLAVFWISGDPNNGARSAEMGRKGFKMVSGRYFTGVSGYFFSFS